MRQAEQGRLHAVLRVCRQDERLQPAVSADEGGLLAWDQSAGVLHAGEPERRRDQAAEHCAQAERPGKLDHGTARAGELSAAVLPQDVRLHHRFAHQKVRHARAVCAAVQV
uniref:(northern house mosquito) hypothetical protein n=1 Tax=Culex pipiens TaxID=7175 RepID=A0A8D8B2I2_CULPI